MKKAEINYWVDLGIGIAFLLSAISGLVFLLPIDFAAGTTPKVLWLSLSTWDVLHTWGSLGLIAGVMAHMVLHWKWFTSMTRRTLLPGSKKPVGTRQPVGEKQPAGTKALSRRQFIYFASGAAAVALFGGLLARQDASASSEMTGNTGLTPNQPLNSQQTASTNTTQPTSTPDIPPTATPEVLASPTSEVLAVPIVEATATPVQTQQLNPPVCNRGCSYPGRCRRYRDQNGNSICDLTEWT